jgi:pimeloyl-ACP methyl ester carboxylesterase
MVPLAEAGCRVISIDLPGWGKSSPWGDGPLGEVDAQAAVLAILECAEASEVTLMGKSWGGGIALATALAHPDRVTRLVLTAPAIRDPGRLGELLQPVLLAWAEDDPVIPFQVAAHLVTTIPNARLVTYPTGGHSAGPNNAKDFAAQVIAFLELGEPTMENADSHQKGE